MLVVLHESWPAHMPFLMLIGVGYALFGMFWGRMGANASRASWGLCLVSLGWVIS